MLRVHRAPHVRLAPSLGARAAALGAVDGDLLRISNDNGWVMLAALVENIHDDAVWAPRNSAGSQLLANLGVAHNSVVTVVKACLMQNSLAKTQVGSS